MSLNMAIYGMLKAGDVLLLPGMEHNAVSRPAADLEDRGIIKVRTLLADPDTIELTIKYVEGTGRFEHVKPGAPNRESKANERGTRRPSKNRRNNEEERDRQGREATRGERTERRRTRVDDRR